MGKTYSKAPDDASARVEFLLRRYYPELKSEMLTLKIDLLSVANDGDGPALSHQGYPAAAVVRILGPKERTMARGDAEIVIDEEKYSDMSPAERDALLDHELYHIEIKKDKHGKPKLDENGRPKLKLRKHDYQFGWFKVIALRHTGNSGEIQQARGLFGAEQQTFFPFVEVYALKQFVPEKGADVSAARRLAAENFKDMAGKNNMSVEITSGDKSVLIDKDGVKDVSTKKAGRGPKITKADLQADAPIK